jgi:hypothetical protein
MILNFKNIKKKKIFDDNINKYYYVKNLSPININHLHKSTNNNSQKNLREINDINNKNYSNIYDEKAFTERNICNEKRQIIFSRNEKQNKTLNNNNTLLYNSIDIDNNNYNGILLKPKDLITNKIITIKKRPLNILKIKNMNNKKFQKLKYINKEINNLNNKITNINNKNEYKKYDYELFPCQILSFFIDPSINAPNIKSFINNEKGIIIKKIEEHNIKEFIFKLDDSIEEMNHALKNGYFTINDQPIKLVPLNDDIKNLDKENMLIKENKIIKDENKLLSKEDKMKNELIKKLYKEKEIAMKEINRLNKENEELKSTNESLRKENEKIRQENHNKKEEELIIK